MEEKNNIQLVTEFMETLSAFHQFFVIQALSYYAEAVLSDQETFRMSIKNNDFPAQLWVHCANDWIRLCNERHAT